MPLPRRACRLLAAFAGLALVVLGAGRVAAAPAHPLEPLGADEIATIAAVLRADGRFSAESSFAWLELQEPDKKVVAEFKPGGDFPRLARLDAIDYERRKAFAVVVDVRARKVLAATEIVGAQPALIERDTLIAVEVLEADPRVKAALIARGLKVPGKVSDSVVVQVGAVGHDPDLAREGGRLMRAFFGAEQGAINDFGPFLDGLSAVVDVYSRQVIRFVDQPGAPTVRVPHDIFDPKVRGSSARGVRPARPREARRDFTVERNVVRWRNWQLRYGFNLREGLVLYQVSFDDQGRRRSILYRGSVSELLTAYGDASDLWSAFELFDQGVFGLGASAVAVQVGREVPANAVLLDQVLPDPDRPRLTANARPYVYVYERDAGNLMYYPQGRRVFHARATELVIGFIASFGNYAYGINWVFRQDGSFAVEIELAGEVLTRFVRAATCESCQAVAGGPGPNGESRSTTSRGDDRYAALVYPNLVALNHQHWFNLRLDFDIDGPANAVMENNLVRASREPHREGAPEERWFAARHTVLGRAIEAKRDANHESARTWTVYNPAAVDRAGRPAGYTIVPMANAATIYPPARKAETVGFTFHHLWVTPYRPEQVYAAGRYPNQARADDIDTLDHYADDSSIYDRDVVVWYSLGMTHLPRPEDYPVMSNERVSVEFRPQGFFERNPALGLGTVGND